VARAWPLTGRDRELAVIRASIRPGSRPGGLVFAGAAGVGKTRLAREALDLAAARGATTRWAYATASSRHMPLGAFAGLLEDPVRPPADAVSRAVETLGRGVGPAGVVVGVDDAHLLDDLSAVLVQRLAVSGVATVVLTVRAGEPVPEAVSRLWRDEQVRRVEIQPLTRAATEDLLRVVLGGPIDSGSTSRLWSLTRGNALFLRHLVDGELESGRLCLVDGLWCWQSAPMRLPPVLTQVVGDVMGRIGDDVRDVVDLLALGEPLTPAVLGNLTGPRAVEEAESAGLLRVGPDDRGDLQARLAHPMYGEVRRASLGTLRARRLRGLIATSLLSAGTHPTADLLRRAVLTVDSDLPPDPTLFVSAAHQAVRLFDLVLGERLARAAVDAGGGMDAELALAMALSWLSRGEEAEEILGRLAASAPQAEARTMATAARIGNLLWTLRRPGEAEAVLAAALADPPDEVARDLLLAFRVALDASLGRAGHAIVGGTPLLSPAPRDDRVALIAGSGVAAAAAVVGDLDLLARAASVGDAAGSRAFVSIPRFGLGDWHILGLRLAGELSAALGVAHRLQDASQDVPGPARLMGLVLRGHAELATGRVRTAERFLREAWAGLGASPHEFRFRCRTLLALALSIAGDPEARALVDELGDGGHPAYALLAPDDVLARAWVEAAEGATSRAVATAHAAAALARGLESPAYEVLALQTAVHLGDGAVAGRLDELAAAVGGLRAPTAAAHARALAERDGDGLAAASRAWESLGDLLAAADAAAQASLALAPAGRKGSASAAAARADRLASACEDARTPAMVAAARPLPLTAREREIVTLAAGGLSNREIAELLVLSVRTVEGHLYRAGHKLGVGDRAAFHTLLGDGKNE
jgi:DNA-binding NarL/FixJ family response regulator